MDVLIVEPLDPDVQDWLSRRHSVRYAPQLAQQPQDFRSALRNVRALIIPPSVALDGDAIRGAPLLCGVGRLSAGAENIDLHACAAADIEVVRPAGASATSEAEFVICGLLQMLRRVPVVSDEGLLVGRELSGRQVGIVGMAAAAKPLTQLLLAFGTSVVGYDPALHPSDPIWQRFGVQPLALSELMESCDGVCVLLPYFTRYRGLLGDRFLAVCKPNQVLVSLAHSSVFDETALADALTSGRLAAAWFDSMEPGMLHAGRPLRHLDTLQVTPHVASTTLESRSRSAWAVARRLDELLNGTGRSGGERLSDARQQAPDDLADLADGPAPA